MMLVFCKQACIIKIDGSMKDFVDLQKNLQNYNKFNMNPHLNNKLKLSNPPTTIQRTNTYSY